eukprot:ANDGO_05269.mRNA.1 hypothetical protein AMSG_07054
MSDRPAELSLAADAVQVYKVENGVQEYLETAELRVLETVITDAEKAEAEFPEDSPGEILLLQIGSLNLPLAPHIPTLRLARRNYMIAQNGGVFYAILFPHDCEEEIINEFEELLKSRTAYKITGTDGKVVAVASKTTTGVAVGSAMIVKGIEKGTAMAVKGLRFASGFIRSKVKPKEEAVHVSSQVMSKAHQAKILSSTAVTVSQGLVNGMVAMSKEMAKTLAEGINKTEFGHKMQSNSSGPKMQAAKQVGFATLAAVSDIFEAMGKAGKTVVKEAGNATAEVVGHRYGAEAEDLTRVAGAAAGNLGLAASNVSGLGMKTIVKKTAVETAKEVAKNESSENSSKNPDSVNEEVE